MRCFRKILKASSGVLVTAMLMVRCETIIDLDLPEHESAITLNGIIHPDSAIFVQLSENKFILEEDNSFVPISNADIDLFRGETFLGRFTEIYPRGNYRTDIKPLAGKEYRITVEKSGYNKVEAIARMPDHFPEVELISVGLRPGSGKTFRLTYSLDDPPGENYYETLLFQWASFLIPETDTSNVVDEWRDRLNYTYVDNDLNQFEDNPTEYLLSDQLFDGKVKEFTIEFRINDYYFPEGEERKADTIELVLQVRQLSEEYYRYQTSLALQNNSDNPFGEPVQVFNNIQNGFGIFAGYVSDTINFEVIRKE